MERRNDAQGRWRNKVVAFRMSKEEDELLEKYVNLSGLTKQDYIISRLLQREIVVQGNTRIHKALKNQMRDICKELQGIRDGQGLQEDMFLQLSQIVTTLEGLKGV
ncbi:MAG: hypothetical protein R3Y24_00030 [Eubacteriales bacterium]